MSHEPPSRLIHLMNHVHGPQSPVETRVSTSGWSLKHLLNSGKSFRPVPRVFLREAQKAINRFEIDGVPLIIHGLHQEYNWLRKEFHPEWLKEHGPKNINVRNIYDWTDETMLLQDFIDQCRAAPPLSPLEGD
ncbi:hypothetical protein H0H93_011675 [Arthromyces matolae]|nr:hypothetical protein H0H93_011675 [Arthromyces matolae]